MHDPLPASWEQRRPAKRVISVEEFRATLQEAADPLVAVVNGLRAQEPDGWTQEQLVRFYRHATALETLLDNHGARHNATFFRLRELLAFSRWLSAGLSSLIHLLGRLQDYALPDEEWVRTELGPQTHQAALRQANVLTNVMQGLAEEWLASGLLWDEARSDLESSAPLTGRKVLPHDRHAEEDETESDAEAARAQGVRLANRMLSFMRAWSAEARQAPEGLEEMRRFMASFCTEEIARRYEGRVHNLQSHYDSRIAGTVEEVEHPELRRLRGTTSLVLHLLENVTALTHLYERHDVYERAGESRELFDRWVSEEAILRTVIHDGVVAAYACLKRAQPLAEGLLQKIAVQEERSLTLPDGVTMHARPLSLIVTVVQKHGTPVELQVAGESCSAASMLQMLVLVGTHPQERTYLFRGEPAALEDLEVLFHHKLGEEGCEDFPPQLSYLRR